MYLNSTEAEIDSYNKIETYPMIKKNKARLLGIVGDQCVTLGRISLRR